MTFTHLLVGWIVIVLGLLTGTVLGMFFHDEAWLGGYTSWRRRMLRLVHISLVGTGLLNVAFTGSVRCLQIDPPPAIASVLLLVGTASMPLVCLLSAWRAGFRHLFFVPVVSLLVGCVDFLYQGLLR